MEPQSLFDDDAPIARIDADGLLAMWNEAAKAHGMRSARELNTGRRRRVAKILKEKPSRSYWQDVIERISQSGFCTGRLPGRDRRTWHADFDFLTRSETHTKVLEGKYDDGEFARAHGSADRGRAHVYSYAPVLGMKQISGGH
jgi:hypothetical protein